MISLRHGAVALRDRSVKKATDDKAKLRKGLIPHREALRVLLTSTATDDLPKHIRDELPAIISHWLQSPLSPPILIDKEYRTIWRSRLSTYVGSQSPKS